MVVTDVYNKLSLYFGKDTKHKILNIKISKGTTFDKPSFSFLHDDIHYTITSGMDWEVKDKVLIDIYNEIQTLKRNRVIDDIIK